MYSTSSSRTSNKKETFAVSFLLLVPSPILLVPSHLNPHSPLPGGIFGLRPGGRSRLGAPLRQTFAVSFLLLVPSPILLVPSHLNPHSPLPGGIFGRAVHPYAQGRDSGVRRNSSGALSLRHRTARMQQFSAAKGINAQVFCAHSMKTVMRTSFCTTKGKFRPQFAFRGKRRPPPAAICLRSSLTTFKTGRDRQKHVAAKCQYMWHFLLLAVAILGSPGIIRGNEGSK